MPAPHRRCGDRDAGAVVGDLEVQGWALLMQPQRAPGGAGVTGDVAQSLQRDVIGGNLDRSCQWGKPLGQIQVDRRGLLTLAVYP